MKKFVLDIIKDVETSGLSIQLVDDKYVYCYAGDKSLESRVSGWFDPDDKQCALQVAIKRPEKIWQENLIHEYAHFLQWKENKKQKNMDYNDAMGDIEEWTKGKRKLSKNRLWECVDIIQRDEIDAEKRAVRMLRKWKLYNAKNIGGYIQGANSYIITYSMVAVAKQWPDPLAYHVKEIVNRMPRRFLKDYSEAYVPYIKIFYDYCLKSK